MSNPTTQAYGEGNGLVAGRVETDQVALVADTYYLGMPLKYEVDGSAAVTGTGNGTATAITANAGVIAGAWTCTFTAALLFDLADPNGNIVGQFSVPNGDALKIEYNGLKFTITDGGTAWDATSVVTITIGTGGKYEYTADLTIASAIFNGETVELSSAGYGSVIKAGEIYEAALVDGSNSALTLTEATITALGVNGFIVKRTA